MKDIYDQLSNEYNKRSKYISISQYTILKPFINLLKKGSTVLDVGCGVGLDSAILQRNGMKMISIDTSKGMIKYAKQNCKPKIMNFFDYKGIVDGVILDAFVHLFKKPDIVFKKLKEIIHKNSIIFISTTLHKKSRQGIFIKEGYKKKVKRFRRFYTEKEIKKVIIDNGFYIISTYYDYESQRNKIWINIIAKCQK